jgi:hypothetical protein
LAERVFSFLLAVTEVNVLLADFYFNQGNEPSLLEFRKEFASAFLNNNYF